MLRIALSSIVPNFMLLSKSAQLFHISAQLIHNLIRILQNMLNKIHMFIENETFHIIFPYHFKKIIVRYTKIGYNIDVLR